MKIINSIKLQKQAEELQQERQVFELLQSQIQENFIKLSNILGHKIESYDPTEVISFLLSLNRDKLNLSEDQKELFDSTLEETSELLEEMHYRFIEIVMSSEEFRKLAGNL